ncbi:MAG: MarR family transcriptional regulator [Chloroflexota bacterium]|nr:MarR family transcriptional regulator [Chloroflexota bacterium]
MRDSVLDSIVENIFIVLPLFRRSFRDMDLDSVADGISHPHLMVLKMLEEHEKLSLSAIGDRQFISRPQMTHIVDRLVSLGMVERTADAIDRRVTNVTLTDRGRQVIQDCDEFIKKSMKEWLSALSDGDIEEMSAALSKLAEIGSKLK